MLFLLDCLHSCSIGFSPPSKQQLSSHDLLTELLGMIIYVTAERASLFVSA